MSKWNVALSTTEPYNYVGMIQVRQGNKNSETMEATISQNGIPVDLSQCKAYLEAILSNGFVIQQAVKIIDAKTAKFNIHLMSIQCRRYIVKRQILSFTKEKM